MAHHFTGDPIPWPNNGYHRVWKHPNLLDGFRNALNWHSDNVDKTDLTVVGEKIHDASDVSVFNYYDDSLENGRLTVGYAYCNQKSGADATECNHFHVGLNSALDFPKRTATCHEFGHTLGWQDYSSKADGTKNSCTNYWAIAQDKKTNTHSGHDISDHINVRY